MKKKNFTRAILHGGKFMMIVVVVVVLVQDCKKKKLNVRKRQGREGGTKSAQSKSVSTHTYSHKYIYT
jgi:hypothetical protein